MDNRRLVEQAVKAGIKSYADSRRLLIAPFIEKNFSFKGAWKINRCALGKDLLRAPANIAWAPVYFLAKMGGAATRKVGLKSVADRLCSAPPGFRTDVEREVEWLLYSDFLELPYECKGRKSEKNALLTHILAEGALIDLFEETLRPFAEMGEDSSLRTSLEKKLGTYVDNRKDVSELTAALMGISAGLAAHKGVNLGAVGLGQATAGAIAHNMAVSNFILGESIGGIYYSIFPGAAAASTGLIVGLTGGIAAALGVVSAFSGILADPVQKALGLHRRKLNRLVNAIENQLSGEGKEAYALREGYVARLLDFLDILMSVARAAT
jgi:hypothetical protein